MIAATPALVISSLKYGDSSLIVKLYTAKYGLQSFLLKGILGKKKGVFKAGHFQPLTHLDIVGSFGKDGKLGYLREAAIAIPYQSVHSDIRKSTVTLFLAELLSVSIRETEPDEGLFAFMNNAFQWLDHQEKIANFHIRFLIGLTRFLGIFPDISAKNLPYFDLNEGAFTPIVPVHPMLAGELLNSFVKFLDADFEQSALINLSQQGRRDLLKALIHYYELHLPGFRKPRSLEVFDAVFS
ncbi:MAG: hypothetical protein RLZZ241_1572 [Bacteroidota bacterium]|jgi:DNA repair protein RecO (recombination protein O)